MPTILNYQGHIRNWKNLCDELGIDKSLSREQRELEIIENGYAKWGKSVADHLYGMFAFAVKENDRIFAVRDHFGTVPFYYYVTADKKLLCSPSIRDIMEQDGFVKELNVDMLQIYMTLTYVAGEDTFFKGVKKLMPGHLLEFADGRLEIERYWKPDFKPDYSKSLDEWADEIHTTLQQIIPEVLEDDEKAESFLSGGVDSSYVLAMTRAERADSCGYEDERFDESPLAEKTAELLGVKFARSIIQPEDYFSIVPYVMYNMEQPLGDASAIVFALGCKAVDEKICFSGEGSDEFFGGYNMYRNAERYGDNLKTFYIGNTNIMKEDEKQRILKHYNSDILPINLVKYIYDETEGLDPLTKMSDVDIQIWLEGDIYLNVNKMSRATGIEIRMPLTDRRIFDIASRMPSEYKVNDVTNKVAFRTAARKVLPEEIAFRKKLGFIVPIRIWLADERYNADVRAKFSGETAEKFFNVDEIQNIFADYIGGNSDNWRKIWTIYTFLVWYEEYFVKR